MSGSLGDVDVLLGRVERPAWDWATIGLTRGARDVRASICDFRHHKGVCGSMGHPQESERLHDDSYRGKMKPKQPLRRSIAMRLATSASNTLWLSHAISRGLRVSQGGGHASSPRRDAKGIWARRSLHFSSARCWIAWCIAPSTSHGEAQA